MISYGMGEHSIVEIAEALDAGIAVSDITYISGTTVKTKSLDSVYDAVMLPSFEELKADRLSYARSFYTQYCNTDPFSGKRLVEPYSEHLYVVQKMCIRDRNHIAPHFCDCFKAVHNAVIQNVKGPERIFLPA